LVELNGRHAVGRGQNDVGVGRGVPRVVTGIGQGSRDDPGLEGAGPGEADLAAGTVGLPHDDADADPEESAEVNDSTAPS